MAHAPRLLALLLLAAPVLIGGACSSTDEGALSREEQINLHREFAQKFLRDGQYARAEQQADMGLELDRNDHDLLLVKGWVRIKRGKTEDVLMAEKIFRELDAREDFRVHVGLAEALERRGVLYWESADAVESGQRATQAADPRARAEELRAQARGYWAESRTEYLRALESKPTWIQTINGLQRVAALEGDHAAALKWSLQLVELSQKELDFWRAELERPNLSAAQEDQFRQMIASGEMLVLETRLQASTLLVRLGRKSDGITQLDAAASLAPRRAEIYSRRAQLLHELGENGRARDDIQTFLRISSLPTEHPDVQRALDLLAECEKALGTARR